MADLTREPGTQVETEAVRRFFRAIEESGALPRGLLAAEGAAAVLCTLLRRLRADDAREFVDALPASIQNYVDKCNRSSDEKAEPLDRAAFVRAVEDGFTGLTTSGAERLTLAVFSAVQAFLPEAEAEKVHRKLPHDLQQLWRPH
jgi:uncharacterized protein (DUF2267 family)